MECGRQAAVSAGVRNGRDALSVRRWRSPEEEMASGGTSMMKRGGMAVMTQNRSLGKALRFWPLPVRATSGEKARRTDKNDSCSVLARLNPM